METIFRTNVQGAYNAGRHEVAQAVKKERPYWRYQAIPDSRTSEVCEKCDGTVMAADSAWFRTHYPPPPLHPNCRCIAVTLTEAQAKREGISARGPNVKPAAGFGLAPTGGGRSDWEPEPQDYPKEFADELEAKEEDD